MKILAQANFFNPITVYDTNAPEEPSGFMNSVKEFLRPVIQVQSDDGRPLYKTGEFYSPVGQFYVAGFLGILLVGTVILVARNSRKNKNALR